MTYDQMRLGAIEKMAKCKFLIKTSKMKKTDSK